MQILQTIFLLLILTLQSNTAYSNNLSYKTLLSSNIHQAAIKKDDVRVTARLLLLNEKNELLLMKIEDNSVFDPTKNNVEPVRWVTVGGKVEDGENLFAAARRELFEETGFDNVAIGPRVWIKHHKLNWHGRLIKVEDNFFVARIFKSPISVATMEDSERKVFKEFKWWKLEELEHTHEVLKPFQLNTHLLKELIAGNIPNTPIVLENEE